jgi:hypothetical protein
VAGQRGFGVLGIDMAPLAVEPAYAKLEGRRLDCGFATLDFLAASPQGAFQFIFDRGCFMSSMNPRRESVFPRGSRRRSRLEACG